jgi:RimJ/RimL family protein N-acetyltransferase
MEPGFDYSKLYIRMLGWDDLLRFERACRDSEKELTEYLSLGEGMSQYISVDYWSLLNALLADQTFDLYGFFDGDQLIGSASFHKHHFELGTQITYWIRGGYHGKGLGKLFLFLLLREALGRKNLLFVDLIIDLENKASLSIVEDLYLDRIAEWEGSESGQGSKNSGRFAKYQVYENIFQCHAKDRGMTPAELLDEYYLLWLRGIDARNFLPHYKLQEDRPRTLRNTLRLATNKETKTSRRQSPNTPS